jgi:hypothetical protein
MPAAAPWIIQGGLAAGSAIAGHYASKSAAKGAMARSPEEQQALDRISGLVGPTAAMGRQFSSMALPQIGRAFNYYGNLVGGDRAALRGAVAPETAEIGEAYKGADQTIGRSYLQGGERAQALAENARSRSGKIASLVSGVRPMAAEALSRLAPAVANVGQQGQYLAGILNQGVLQQGWQNRLLGQQAGTAASNRWGQLFARLSELVASGGKTGGKTTTTQPSTAGSNIWSLLPGYGTSLPGLYGDPEDYS